ncbi:hypothetical protein BGZ46_009412 [Entomortierella lignicola]|nr:hypothetical protein BGZ46_009412 [Entomortierella lignicola]
MVKPASSGNEGSMISVMSVPIMDPFYRELQALQSDHNLILKKLKQAQQMLQGSYQELAMAQQRSERAEADCARLRTQMDIIIKNHIDHHPERESLVQQLAELQAKLELEQGSKKALEQEYSALYQEFLRFKSNNPHLSDSTNFSLSPTSTISVRSLSFTSFLRGSSSESQRGNRNSTSGEIDRTPSVKSQSTENRNVFLNSQDQQAPSTPIPSHQQASSKSSFEHEKETSLSIEQFEAQKRFCEKLQEENVAMKMELQDLRHRYNAEKDSIKSYMSLFETLQKKQANALAVSQSEIEILRSTIHEQHHCLNVRESLIQTFAATVNSQAIDIEILTNRSCRDQAAIARVEQELALLFEASLMMLERWFGNIQQTKEKLERCMGPIRETIQQLGASDVVQEWDLFEAVVKRMMDELARSLMKQQMAQDLELNTGIVNYNYYSSKAYYRERRQRRRTSSSYSSTSIMPTYNSGYNNSKSTLYSTDDYNIDRDHKMVEETTPVVFDNTSSQEVFVWRKFTADTFLENCVTSVENLAQEKRKLQLRIAELTQQLAIQEERWCSRGEDKEKAKESNENLPEEKIERNNPENICNEERQRTDTGATAQGASTTEAESEKSFQQLEDITKKILEWADNCRSSPCPKNNLSISTQSNLEDEVLSLDISDVTLSRNPPEQHQSQPLTVMRTELDTINDNTLRRQNLETLIQWVYQEISKSSTKSREGCEKTEEASVAHMGSETMERINDINSSSSGSNSNCGENTKLKTRPKAIITTLSSEYNIASPSHSPDSSCFTAPLSASSSCSSTSGCYFSNRVNIGGLGMPRISPGLVGIGSGKVSILDMDAFCHDLAFRSFPKQHQWSKSKGASKDSKGAMTATTLLQTWNPVSTGAAALPSLPSTPTSTSASIVFKH